MHHKAMRPLFASGIAGTPLYDRGFDCIREFEASAASRTAEAAILDRTTRSLGAIYLYGYAVEMRIKAVYFHNAGFPGTHPITTTDRADALALWQILGLMQKPGQHDIAGWAQLAVSARPTSPYAPYGAFGSEISGKAARLYLLWRETLRYRSTRPSENELRTARSIAIWFEQNYDQMK